MSDDPYSATVRALFAAPRHAGELDDGIEVMLDEPGVRLRLSARVSDGQLAALRFRAWGCPHLIAAAEAFCDRYEGRPPHDLCNFTAAELMQSLPVPVTKTGRILVIEDAVRSLGLRLCGTSNSEQED